MHEAQLILSAVTIAVVLLGVFMSNQRLNSMDVRLDTRMTSLDARMSSLENKFDTKIDLVTGKVFDLDNRLSRIEEQLRR